MPRLRTRKTSSVGRKSPRVSPYLCQVLLRLFFDLMLVHLQKILFTTDEAHRASHPSEARAHTSRSRPIQKLPPPLAPPRARSSSSAAQIWWLNSAHMGDKCAVWHRHGVRQTRRRVCAWVRVPSFPDVAPRRSEVRRLPLAEELQVTRCCEKHQDTKDKKVICYKIHW